MAIENPIKRYNHLQVTDEQQVSIEAALVEAVLGQIRTGQVMLGESGEGIVKGEKAETQIETPYLQLVMTRLWDEEMRAGSHILRLETMERLGGAERIVRTHLDAVMSTLAPNEQDIAASVFHYLVTPSGTKIAHTIPDLIEYAGLPETNSYLFWRNSPGEATAFCARSPRRLTNRTCRAMKFSTMYLPHRSWIGGHGTFINKSGP